MCPDCEAHGLKKHGSTRSDCSLYTDGVTLEHVLHAVTTILIILIILITHSQASKAYTKASTAACTHPASRQLLVTPQS